MFGSFCFVVLIASSFAGLWGFALVVLLVCLLGLFVWICDFRLSNGWVYYCFGVLCFHFVSCFSLICLFSVPYPLSDCLQSAVLDVVLTCFDVFLLLVLLWCGDHCYGVFACFALTLVFGLIWLFRLLCFCTL